MRTWKWKSPTFSCLAVLSSEKDAIKYFKKTKEAQIYFGTNKLWKDSKECDNNDNEVDDDYNWRWLARIVDDYHYDYDENGDCWSWWWLVLIDDDCWLIMIDDSHGFIKRLFPQIIWIYDKLWKPMIDSFEIVNILLPSLGCSSGALNGSKTFFSLTGDRPNWNDNFKH